MIRGLVNQFRKQAANTSNDGVVEPDPRLVMAVLAVGVICGALFTSPSNAVETPASASAAASVVDR